MKQPKKKKYPKLKTDDVESCEGYPYKVSHIAWDVDDPDELDDLPDTVIVYVPEELVAADEEEEYIREYLSNEYGFCHNGFLYREA